MVLIPGLPDDVAGECLVRVHYSQFSIIPKVCKAWKSEFQSPEFRLYRMQTSNFQKLIVAPHISLLKQQPITPVHLIILEPETGIWSCLPPIPNLPNGLPLLFCEVVSCISSFVMLVGLNSDNRQCAINVFVFDFLSSSWRRGANMSCLYPVPDGCTFDGYHMVYVLCSSDARYYTRTKSRSIIAYDTEKDEWTTLSDMSSICDGGYRAIFHRGKIHVACQEDSTEIATWRDFDVSTRQWNLSQQKFLPSLELLRVICDDNGEWYACSYDGDVLALRGSRWEAIAKLPYDVSNAKFVTLWKSKLLVIGSENYYRSYHNKAYMLNLKNHKWTRVKTPRELRYIHSACSVEI